MPRLNITPRAKREAKRALARRKKQPKSRRAGLTKSQARKAGVNSGVERAKQIIRSETVSERDAKSIARFHQRFKNCRTKRCEEAIDLWGGRTFGRKAIRFAKKLK